MNMVRMMAIMNTGNCVTFTRHEGGYDTRVNMFWYFYIQWDKLMDRIKHHDYSDVK